MILMNSIATSESVPRRLPVQWLEEAPMWTVLLASGSATVPVAPIGVSPAGFSLLANQFKALRPSVRRRRTRPVFAPEGAIADQTPVFPDSSRRKARPGSATVPVAPVGVPPTGLGFKAAFFVVDHPKALMPSARRRRLRARTPALPGGKRSSKGPGIRRNRQIRAFTLLEMMMVIAIIGFIAAMTLPHVSGFAKANTLAAANRQLLDDLAFARQRALVNRSTIYMVFVPPGFWTNTAYEQSSNYAAELGTKNSAVPLNPGALFNAMLGRQYTSYALIAMSTVGDQPGQHFAHYITDWRTLPQGVYISPFEFQTNLQPITISTTNTTTGVTNAVEVSPFSWTAPVPFPSSGSGTSNTLPFIGFSPQGSLIQQLDQYIVLTRGSVFYAQNSNGMPVAGPVDAISTPPGNETNNPNLIQIDWLTSRATLLQNHF
jgi:prepilin-type N-terminal cleavage/methylation domain-containing protein